MAEVMPIPGECCKAKMELRGGRSLQATLQLSIDPTGFVTITSVLLQFRPSHTLSAAIKYICQAWQTEGLSYYVRNRFCVLSSSDWNTGGIISHVILWSGINKQKVTFKAINFTPANLTISSKLDPDTKGLEMQHVRIQQ